MKKIFLVLAATVVLAGCSKDECKTKYERTYKISNQTDKTITVKGFFSYDGYGDSNATTPIAPGKSEIVCKLSWLGPCGRNIVLENTAEDNHIAPFSTSEANMATMGWKTFEMTVEEKNISKDIWRYKHWSYTGDYYKETYTLTVTDELMSKL